MNVGVERRHSLNRFGLLDDEGAVEDAQRRGRHGDLDSVVDAWENLVIVDESDIIGRRNVLTDDAPASIFCRDRGAGQPKWRR